MRADLGGLVGRTVEDALNGLLEEAGDLVGAGHYERKLATTSGEVTIRMPKPEGMRFTTAIIERYRRREASVEEAMIETCLAGVSTRRIEDAGEILWGSSVSASTASNPNEKALASVEGWRNRPLERACPYVHVDGIYLKRSWGGSYENVAVMVATGVSDDGYREVIGAAEGFTESAECRREFPSWLKSRGLRGVRTFTGDKAAGMVGSIAEVFPEAAYQRCTVHFYRNVLAGVPKSKRPKVAAMLKAVHVVESREAAEAKAIEVASELEGSGMKEAARVVMDGCAETLTYTRFPPRALAEDQDQQRHRAAQPRDPQAHPGGGHLPGRKKRPHARDREAQVRRGERVGRPPLPGRDAAGRVAAPEGGPRGCRKVRKDLDGTRRPLHPPLTERRSRPSEVLLARLLFGGTLPLVLKSTKGVFQ